MSNDQPYEHLKFFDNGTSNVFQQPSLVGSNDSSNANSSIKQEFNPSKGVDERLPIHKHAFVVAYLQKLKQGQTAFTDDIMRELNINLKEDNEVLGMLKSNPRIDCSSADGLNCFRYIAKFIINNERELLLKINYIKNGVSLNDIRDCYDGITDDVMNAIVGGDIIAVKNRINKELILYPRNRPFLTRLSGHTTATPGNSMITTSNDLRNEIRRGEAISLDDVWYRVSCSTCNVDSTGVTGGTAPTSVSLDSNMAINNTKFTYADEFSAKVLPLDGAFERSEDGLEHRIGDSDTIGDDSVATMKEKEESVENKPVVGTGVRHGCTTDVKKHWNSTLEHLKPFLMTSTANNNNDGVKLLNNELLTLNLISKASTLSHTTDKKPIFDDSDTHRKKKPKKMNHNITSVHNAHLEGTELGKILKETAVAMSIQQQKMS